MTSKPKPDVARGEITIQKVINFKASSGETFIVKPCPTNVDKLLITLPCGEEDTVLKDRLKPFLEAALAIRFSVLKNHDKLDKVQSYTALTARMNQHVVYSLCKLNSDTFRLKRTYRGNTPNSKEFDNKEFRAFCRAILDAMDE